jgi:Carboxypeptidase regulatory-like domain
VTRNWSVLFRKTLPLFPRFCLLLLALAILGGFGPARADCSQQDPRKPYALIFGTVWGPDDHPVYGVHVKVRRADQKRAKWDLYSDHRGEFALRLPPAKADYVVSADLKGFKSLNGKQLHLAEEVTVHIEADERQDIGLHLKE